MTSEMGRNVSWDSARAIAHDRAPFGHIADIELASAIGRTLANDLVALSDLPPAPTAMMDGYAVRGPAPWRIIGEVRAGQHVSTIDSGQALRVSTGAHIPELSDMVIAQEHATVVDDSVTGFVNDSERNNIRIPGDEAQRGELIAAAGTFITPVIAGLAHTAGYDTAPTYVPPLVDVFVTGDELITTGPSRPGAIRDSLTVQVPVWIRYCGAQLSNINRTRDSLNDMVTAITQSDSGIIITTGGTAHGPHDYVRPALEQLGAELLVDEMNTRPGHPTVLAQLPSGQFIASLPGNPLAACVSFLTVVDPLIRKMTGRALAPLIDCTMDAINETSKMRIMPVTVEGGIATPTEYRGSAMLRGLSVATALAVVAPGSRHGRLLMLPWQQS